MEETKLLNDTAVCTECNEEYIPEMSFFKDTRCDSCIEHEIDRVYSNKGNPWEDFGDDYDYTRGETEPLLDNESVCDDCGEVFTVSEHSYGHYLCPECYASTDDNRYKIRKCNKCGNIYHPMDESDLHCVNCRGVEQW